MTEWRLFPEGTIPEHTLPEWYAERERAPHVDEALHRPRLELAAAMARDTLGMVTLVDLGAGDGGLLQLLAGSGIECWGYDLQQSNVDGALERGVEVYLHNVLTDEIEWGEIAVATEMIEHLVDPHGFVSWVREHAQVMIASSPWTETAESHYGYHTWAWDREGYRAMFEAAGWQVVDHRAAGMFQVLKAVQP